MSIPIEKIKCGTKVVITNVGLDDAAYRKREKLLGLICTISEHEDHRFSPVRVGKDGWFRCTIYFEENPTLSSNPFYFKRIKFRLATDEEIALAEQKKTEPKTPDSSCGELEFLIVLESARKWFMLREHPEWKNEDYFKRFPKDHQIYTLAEMSEASDCSCCSLWANWCGNGITKCPLDQKGLWCNSGSFRKDKKFWTSNLSPWGDWRCATANDLRRGAADKIFRAMIDWLAAYGRLTEYRCFAQNCHGISQPKIIREKL